MRYAVQGKLADVYAEAANYTAYTMESNYVGTSFSLVNPDTVQQTLTDSAACLVPTVDASKDYSWNRSHVATALTKGVLLGEPIPKIAERVGKVADMGRSAAVRTARTAMTGAENAGRLDMVKRAEAMGLDVELEWVATLDGRTRHSHRAVDGEKVKSGGKFSNGCRYPGDPQAPYAEIYNCRCTLGYVVGGVGTEDAKRAEKLGGMSYAEWKVNAASAKQLKKLINDGNERIASLQKRASVLEDKETFSGIWYAKTPSLADWRELKNSGSIAKKIDYYKGKMAEAVKGDASWTANNDKLKAVRRFDKRGKEYEALTSQIAEAKDKLAVIQGLYDKKFAKLYDTANTKWAGAFSEDRKKAARFSSKRDVDAALRPAAGRTWRNATQEQREAIYRYTGKYNPYNAPLNGYRTLHSWNWYDRSLYEGPNKVWIDWWKHGNDIRRMTEYIEDSDLPCDIWLTRGVNGLDTLTNMLGMPFGSLDKWTNAELQTLVSQEGRLPGFVSCGSLDGTGFRNRDVTFKIYAPKGSHAAYAEPFSQYGGSKQGLTWDGLQGQTCFNDEFETIIQRGGMYKITSINKSGSRYYVELEHHPEVGYDLFQQDDSEWKGSREQTEEPR